MKFRRRHRQTQHEGGEDSFLDIVANLVGILVILVTVIGVRAQDAWEEHETEPPQVNRELTGARDRVKSEHDRLHTNVFEIKQRSDQMAQLLEKRRRERHQLQVLLTAARMELDERRSVLDQQQQSQVMIDADARELADALRRVSAQSQLLKSEADRPIELEHLPTPLARTVFGHEEHFRLLHGRLVYVPLNELTSLLREQAPNKAYRLRETREITDTLGPVQGFHLRYTMHRRTVAADSPAGPIVRQIAELKQFVLVPMTDNLGEPLEVALEKGSQFRQLVETMRPGATVITVWTYPDSYADFRSLKKWLFERGFAAAARPLPDGHPITGSPTGARSAAQ